MATSEAKRAVSMRKHLERYGTDSVASQAVAKMLTPHATYYQVTQVGKDASVDEIDGAVYRSMSMDPWTMMPTVILVIPTPIAPRNSKSRGWDPHLNQFRWTCLGISLKKARPRWA